MANSARDPYWHAAVRREDRRLPGRRSAIQNECSACHMPMARFQAHVAGASGRSSRTSAAARRRHPEALDGVSCTRLPPASKPRSGAPRASTANSRSTPQAPGARDALRSASRRPGARVMHSVGGGFSRREPTHMEQSEICSTCHTLYTDAARRARGQTIGALPRAGAVPGMAGQRLSSRAELPGLPHDGHRRADGRSPRCSASRGRGSSRHVSRRELLHAGMLNKYRGELGVAALPQELEPVAQRDARAISALRRRRSRSTRRRLATGA